MAGHSKNRRASRVGAGVNSQLVSSSVVSVGHSRMWASALLASAVSGCVWAGIAFGIGYATSPISSTPADAARLYLGGLILSPVIGILIGLTARRFATLSRSGRVIVALANIYLGAFLFFLATSSLNPQIPQGEWSALRALDGAVRGSLFGLTYLGVFRGFFVVLWPASYANHTLIGTVWNQVRRSDHRE
jgi:hypothetical protein